MKTEIPKPLLAAIAAIAVVVLAVVGFNAMRPVDATKLQPDDYKYDPAEVRAKLLKEGKATP
jgi:hypothetical protein